uniref:Uncharacterized protein n=1 Tax=Arundo donax TaxID=35708 RepID=A0A0A8YTK0_ARUDO
MANLGWYNTFSVGIVPTDSAGLLELIARSL